MKKLLGLAFVGCALYGAIRFLADNEFVFEASLSKVPRGDEGEDCEDESTEATKDAPAEETVSEAEEKLDDASNAASAETPAATEPPVEEPPAEGPTPEAEPPAAPASCG